MKTHLFSVGRLHMQPFRFSERSRLHECFEGYAKKKSETYANQIQDRKLLVLAGACRLEGLASLKLSGLSCSAAELHL